MAKIVQQTVSADGKTFQRFPIKTHLIAIKEPLDPLVERYVLPERQEGDWLAISEKVVTITQGRVVHISVVREGMLAKLLVKGVKKWSNDIGFSHPKKMQVAVWQAGRARMVAAAVIGAVGRAFGRHGDFWRVADHGISEIDGFVPSAMPPYNEFAMLGPEDPDGVCRHIEEKFSLPTVILDANNLNVEVLGMSPRVPVSRQRAREIMLDNPMGQDDEKTPFILVRETSG